MQDRLESLASKAREEIARAQDAAGLEALRVRYLGKKGELSAVLGGMGKLAPDERRRVGEIANRVKARGGGDARGGRRAHRPDAALEAELDGAADRRDAAGPDAPAGAAARRCRGRWRRSPAPSSGSASTWCRARRSSSTLYNFEALNFPADHPARDMQDTFYVHGDYLQHDPGGIVLRARTPRPVQVRTMLTRKPPIRVVMPGKVYRARLGRDAHADVPPDRGAAGGPEGHLGRAEGDAGRLRARLLRPGPPDALPPVVLPLHRALG